MARGRPQKQSIEFAGWAVDIFDNEPKIDKLLDAQGCQGFVIYFYLCQRAYGSNGYFYKWSYDDAPTTARKIGGGVGSQAVIDTVRLCLRVGLFDDSLHVGHQILTSRGIQKRYRHVAITRKTQQYVISDYWLLDEHESTGFTLYALKEVKDGDKLNFDPSKVNYDPSKVNYDQYKVKESKVKESKVKESKEEIVGTEVPTLPPAKKPKKEPKQQTETFPLDSVEYLSSKFLADRILKNDPGNTKVPRTEEGLQKWAVHIDYILRIDKRSTEQLKKTLLYATKHHYWSGRILSTKKLRVEFNVLIMEIIQKEAKNDGKYTKNSNPHREKNKINPGEITEGERLLRLEAELGIGQNISDADLDTIY